MMSSRSPDSCSTTVSAEIASVRSPPLHAIGSQLVLLSPVQLVNRLIVFDSAVATLAKRETAVSRDSWRTQARRTAEYLGARHCGASSAHAGLSSHAGCTGSVPHSTTGS